MTEQQVTYSRVLTLVRYQRDMHGRDPDADYSHFDEVAAYAIAERAAREAAERDVTAAVIQNRQARERAHVAEMKLERVREFANGKAVQGRALGDFSMERAGLDLLIILDSPAEGETT